VKGVQPTYWNRFDASIPNDARVDQVLTWLGMPLENRPHMITLYFEDVDNAGHNFGPGSAGVGDAVATVDQNLGRLLDGIAALPHGDDVFVVLVSDHGMMSEPADGADVLDIAQYQGVRLGASGPYASLYVDQGGAERAAAVRDSIAATMPENGVYLRADVPERLHYSADPRAGDIVIVAAEGRTIVAPDRVPDNDGFNHGWDNAFLGMGSIFLAQGPGIAGGQTIDVFESIHIYPLLAHVLGLTPNPDVDGRLEVLQPILGN
jgi:predicted AlkP superfamily pyrophosphatase or phosphodiesterase